MPNHFHLLVREVKEGGITRFMEKLSTSYSMYFNKKYNRTGSLFENRFKAEHVGRDEYLKYLFAYIHLNPVKLIDPKWKENGITNISTAQKYLSNYAYSSIHDYLGIRRSERAVLNPSEFPKYFDSGLEFSDFIQFWLDNRELQGMPLDKGVMQTV